MLIPGTYTCRGGRIAKVYDIIDDSFHGFPVAVGAQFTALGTFLGVETWRADDGQFFMSGKPCSLDIVTPEQAAA